MQRREEEQQIERKKRELQETWKSREEQHTIYSDYDEGEEELSLYVS
jgi:hypothetical protein